MRVTHPDNVQIETNIENATRNLDRRITRRRIAQRAGIGIGVAALLGIGVAVVLGFGGTGAASVPHYYDMQGVVNTAYVDLLIDCVQDAGWDATILDTAEAAPILDSWGVDPDSFSVTNHNLLHDTQGQAGRAISACQDEIASDVGESITAGS